MRKKTMKIMTGMGIGMMIGAVSGAIGSSMTYKKSMMSSKAMRSVENVIDGICDMMK